MQRLGMGGGASIARLESDRFIAFRDLDFRRIPWLAHSSKGTPYEKMVAIGMPRIPPKFLDCVCYLYETEEGARKGTEFGGTGFFVGVASKINPGAHFTYVVTNHHVACTGGASIVRINTMDGGVDIFPFEPHEWHFDPKYDIAIKHIGLVSGRHKMAVFPAAALWTKEAAELHKVGVGDDVFMVGRFIDHDGGPINRPAARFGNISVMPSPLEQPNGHFADAYCIDLHSRSGYSGAPVFAYRTPGSDLEEQMPDDFSQAQILFAGANMLSLLGIHFAQFPESWEISAGAPHLKNEAAKVPLIMEGGYVRGLSGMTCVLPSWTILEVLNSPELQKPRDDADHAEAERRGREGVATPIPEG